MLKYFPFNVFKYSLRSCKVTAYEYYRLTTVEMSAKAITSTSAVQI